MALKARSRTDRVLFARYFLPHVVSDPRGVPKAFCRFHLWSLGAPKVPYRERQAGYKRAIMAPRGHGKTSVYLRVDLIHDICHEFELYIVVMAEGAALARSRVGELATELETNKEIHHFFGPMQGPVWRPALGEFDTANGVSVRAKSMGSQVRGLLHERTNLRPTKIVLDDAEDSREVLNPELRERDRRRLFQDIVPAGDPGGSTNFQFTGTPLHREALLPSLRGNRDWQFAAFPAIEKWPEKMDLWERCRQLWVAAGAPEESEEGEAAALEESPAVAVARRFYEANKRAMDRGARVLWPDNVPLFTLMTKLWGLGDAAFSKEFMLVPRDQTLSTFEMESEEYPARGALRHTIEEDRYGRFLLVDTRSSTDGAISRRKVRLDHLRFVLFHDPAKADPKASKTRARSVPDYAAISVLAIEERPGGVVGHLVDAWMERRPPSEQIQHVFRLAELWGVEAAILEEDTLGLLKQDYIDEVRRRKGAGLFYQLPLRALARQTENKDARIAAMEPAVLNGWLTFGRQLGQAYWNQWVDHPTGDHDDGPDSAEGCWRYARRKRVGFQVVDLGV